MDPVGIAIVVATVAATAAVVLLLNRIGTTPRLELRRVLIFSAVSLVASFLLASVFSFLALGTLAGGGAAPDAGVELGSAILVGGTIALAVGGAGIVGCILAGMLASRWTQRTAIRFWAAAAGALGGSVIVVLASGVFGALPLVPIAGFGFALAAIAPWLGGFLRRTGPAVGTDDTADESASA